MKTRIEVLTVDEKSGVSAKSGKPYTIRKAHCVLHLPEGKQVGILQIPREMEKSPAPGLYDVEFGIHVDFMTQEVGGKVLSLVPVVQSKAA